MAPNKDLSVNEMQKSFFRPPSESFSALLQHASDASTLRCGHEQQQR